ncbi:DUF742 domain-containing protein [Nocardia barduliensis]|uniref:DUF742 domain-containing protein n=1 Tax=Nocardia barduliensis TaxID=2736643 RepID=UPI00157192B5|nr:DUF742 domain-containing protein [Nocardia barduliensis]
MNYPDDFSALEDDPGPLVRPFAVTRGRAARDTHELDILTLIVAIRPAAEGAPLDRECAEILHMCQGRPISLAEVSAQLNLMLAAVKVLIGDLIQSGYITYTDPIRSEGRPDLQLLQAVLDGIRVL